jgi:hypothetical protein
MQIASAARAQRWSKPSLAALSVTSTGPGWVEETDMCAEWENQSIRLRHRRVLRLLANAPHGRADGKTIARFTNEIFELIAAGLVEVHAQTVKEHGRAIQTVSLKITAAGRRAVEE